MLHLYQIKHPNTANASWNLAMEEYVFRNLSPDKDYVLLYRNEKSVIVGRNQNVFEEVNEEFVKEHNIPVLRRISGGGTVYHDPGNINFSFITDYNPSRLHNYRFFNAPVVMALRKAGVDASFNERSDIIAGGRKVSGNAQFSSKGRMISHGTLLFDADMAMLSGVLNVKRPFIESKSQKSVRSDVVNILDLLPEKMSMDAFQELLMGTLIRGHIEHKIVQLSGKDYEQIDQLCKDKYDQWAWNLGRNPRFSIRKKLVKDSKEVTLVMEVNKGVIATVEITVPGDDLFELRRVLNSLEGVRYNKSDISGHLENSANDFGRLNAANITKMLCGDVETVMF